MVESKLVLPSEPTLEAATLSIAETVTDVANKLHDDINLVAHACSLHDRLLMSVIEEIEQLRITNAQLYIRLRHLERKEKNT